MRERRMPVGAELLPEGVHFRVWAPRSSRVEVVLTSSTMSLRSEEGKSHALASEGNGYFSGFVPDAEPGTLYRYRLDKADALYPDPASRFQPYGSDGPSQVIDPDGFEWTDRSWKGASLDGQILYEMHTGTFTPEGTWVAAIEQLPELAALGITTIELLPVADFPGRFGWGYDGVNLFAPTRLYGSPDEFRQFVNSAHKDGLAVILDVVYNHLGPEHAYLKPFAEEYFSERYETEWGDAFNFDGEHSEPVRTFFLSNAAYWIREFHLDGLRLDATQSIFDSSEPHMLAEITRTVRQAAGGRSVLVIGENEPQNTRLLRPIEEGGYGLDALWNEDFHRVAMVSLTGNREAYYSDYRGTPQEFISCVKRGFLYQGQRSKQQGQRRGTPAYDLSSKRTVFYLQNHDQVANAVRGLRVHFLTSPAAYRAMTALLLLGPGTPMLFQGQEYAASTPFHYFGDHGEEIASSIREGRKEFLSQFRNLALPEMQAVILDPGDPRTFESSKLDPLERRRNKEMYELHRDLIRLRREDPVLKKQGEEGLDGAVLYTDAFVLRYFSRLESDRLLIFNFGNAVHLDPAPEPLLAPPAEKTWQILWSSEDPRYGGEGTIPLDSEENWRLPRYAAVVLMAGEERTNRSKVKARTPGNDKTGR